MPLYRCVVAPRLTSYDQRLEIAREVTRIHCEVTAALPQFVHTFFAEDDAGLLPADKRALLLGSIRAGRSAEQKESLTTQMAHALTRVLGLGADQVSVVTVDVPARWVMEGGEVLPEPGDEDAWLAKHAAAEPRAKSFAGTALRPSR
jgi:phenylpyruvate tautomerase PptA (4-oxalocrotonate tautomerase family)